MHMPSGRLYYYACACATAQTPTHYKKKKQQQLLNGVMQCNIMYILPLELSALAALCL